MTHPTSHAYALSIVIPVYNGERTIGRLVEALASLKIAEGHEIILVNDGSPDDSRTVCIELTRRYRTPVTLIDLSRNFGEHNAVLAGLAVAKGRYVVTMDDDLQHPVEAVPAMLEHTRSHNFDVVYSFSATKHHTWWRNLGSRFANWCARIVFRKPGNLYLSTFRCMTAFVAARIASHRGPWPHIDGLIFDITRSIGTLEVEHLPRMEGKSNYTLRRLVRLWGALFFGFSIAPLRTLGLLGLLSGGFGLVLLGATLFGLVEEDVPRIITIVVAAIFIIVAAQFVALGVLGEYVGRLFLSVQGKPPYVVREIYAPAGDRGLPEFDKGKRAAGER